jgi:hypothetical protein
MEIPKNGPNRNLFSVREGVPISVKNVRKSLSIIYEQAQSKCGVAHQQEDRRGYDFGPPTNVRRSGQANEYLTTKSLHESNVLRGDKYGF